MLHVLFLLLRNLAMILPGARHVEKIAMGDACGMRRHIRNCIGRVLVLFVQRLVRSAQLSGEFQPCLLYCTVKQTVYDVFPFVSSRTLQQLSRGRKAVSANGAPHETHSTWCTSSRICPMTFHHLYTGTYSADVPICCVCTRTQLPLLLYTSR